MVIKSASANDVSRPVKLCKGICNLLTRKVEVEMIFINIAHCLGKKKNQNFMEEIS